MTVLEKLKEYVDRDLKLLGYEHKIIIDKIDSLLEEEKQNIILAYKIGYSSGEVEADLNIRDTNVYKQGLEYYNQTFK